VADVFLLLVYLGAGDARRLESGNMMFWSIERCNYFASAVSRRHGSYGSMDYLDPLDRVTAYCVPRQVDPEEERIYE